MPCGTAFHLYADCICSAFLQNINACIRIPVMNCMAFRALPDTNAQIFSSVDFCSRKSCRSDCSDTSLVLCEVHFHTSWLYIPAFRKTLPRKHLLWILPVYGSGSFPSRSDPRHRWFGFRAPASLTVSAGNHSADWLFLMHSGHPEPLLPAVMGIFLLPGKSALFSYEFSHGAFQISGI